ncbi:MAG: O-antigen ligase family protein [Pirellulales bacterium]
MAKLRHVAYHVVAFCARILVLVLISIAPWLVGGASWQHQYSLVQAAWCLTALTWGAVLLSPGRAVPIHSILWGFVVLILMGVAQVVSLPDTLAKRLSGSAPFIQQLQASEPGRQSTVASDAQAASSEPGDSGAVQLAFEARTISVDPIQTRGTLAVFCAAVIVIWAGSVLFADRNWAIVLLVTLAVGGTANAFLGLMQAVSWNHWTLLPMKGRAYFATFVSRNSAPQYYAIATGAALALLGFSYRRRRRMRRKEFRMRYPSASLVERIRNRMEEVFVDLDILALCSFACAAFCVLATAATASRGGALANVGAGVLTLIVTLGTRGHIMRAWVSSVALAVFVIGAMVGLGLDTPLMERMDDLNEVAYVGDDGRTVVWTYALNSLSRYGAFGAGLGTFHFAILPFHTHGLNVWFYHAESIPVEILTEMGFVGLVIAAWIVYRLVSLIRKHIVLDGEKLVLTAVVFAVSAIGFQSTVDFSLILPGIFLPLAALVGSFCARATLHEQAASEDGKRRKGKDRDLESHWNDRTVHRWNAKRVVEHALFGSLLFGLSFICAPDLRGYAEAEQIEEQLNLALADVKTADEYPDERVVKRLLNDAQQAVGQHPTNPELKLLLGKVIRTAWRSHVLRTWDWPKELTVAQRMTWSDPILLSAALRGEVEDPAGSVLRAELAKDAEGAELAGQSADAFRAAWSLSPFDWRAAWGTATSDCGELASQARTETRLGVSLLSGNNAKLILDVGLSALSHGDIEEGKDLVLRAIEIEPRRLFDALPMVAEKLPAEDVIELLPKDPKVQATVAQSLSRLKSWDGYRDSLLARISERYASVGVASLEEWGALAWVASELKDSEQEIAFLRRAVAMSPLRPEIRFSLATKLLEAGRVKEAVEELERCKAQDPSNRAYRDALDKSSEVLDR